MGIFITLAKNVLFTIYLLVDFLFLKKYLLNMFQLLTDQIVK